MAHWDEERDKRWVQMLRSMERPYPHIKPAIDIFEQTGDLAQFSAVLDMFRAAWRKKDLERRESKTP